MATPSKRTIYVVPATEDDYDQLVEWTHTILDRSDPVLDHIFPHAERASEDIPQTREAFMEPSSKTFKAVLTGSKGEGDRMVGYVHVEVQGENWVEEEFAEGMRKGEQSVFGSYLAFRGADASPRLPPNRADPKAFIQFFTKLNLARYEFMGGKPHLRKFPPPPPTSPCLHNHPGSRSRPLVVCRPYVSTYGSWYRTHAVCHAACA